jgi:hypothetical protein
MRIRRQRPARRPHSTDGGDRIFELQARLKHLESELQGLQDSVHRANVRQDKQIQDLLKATQPAAIARAVDDDARRRGI